jgi:protein TonB
MEGLLEGSEHLERELTPEPIAAPAMGSFALHAILIASLVSWGLLGGLFRHNVWGNLGGGEAMQVNLVSSAIPLPNNQPMNQNVLATEKPSQAPEAPSPKTQEKVDETAIPLLGTKVKPQEKNTKKTPPQPTPKTDNTARYGEQSGTSIARATQQVYTSGNTSVDNASFGSLFGWYVQQIDRTMDANSYRQMASPQTPKGAKVTIEFRINRDGSRGDVRLDQSSGSSSWDNVCLRAAQRASRFPELPSGYRGTYLQVTYDCTY